MGLRLRGWIMIAVLRWKRSKFKAHFDGWCSLRLSLLLIFHATNMIKRKIQTSKLCSNILCNSLQAKVNWQKYHKKMEHSFILSFYFPLPCQIRTLNSFPFLFFQRIFGKNQEKTVETKGVGWHFETKLQEKFDFSMVCYMSPFFFGVELCMTKSSN